MRTFLGLIGILIILGASAIARNAQAQASVGADAVRTTGTQNFATSADKPSQHPNLQQAQSSASDASELAGSDFFTINSVRLIDKPSIGAANLPQESVEQSLEVRVTAQENTSSEHLIAKAYFFDRDKKLIATMERPTKTNLWSNEISMSQFDMPAHERPVISTTVSTG